MREGCFSKKKEKKEIQTLEPDILPFELLKRFQLTPPLVWIGFEGGFIFFVKNIY